MEESKTPKIESADLNLEDLFKDFYCVPDFQREYVWETEHVEKLLQDVQDEFYDEDNRLTPEREYFVGSIVACKDSSGIYQLIDGQQRMTTIFLVFCAVRDHLQENTQDVPDTLHNSIRNKRLTDSGDEQELYRLVLQYEDSHGVLAQIAGRAVAVDDIEGTTASIRHITEAYRTIRQFLRINFDDKAAEVRKFLVAFLKRVKLIRILTPNLAHALKVFETINDRGVGLNAMDLLKNLLFMKTSAKDYGKLKDRWKRLVDVIDRAGEKPLRFLRYFVMSQYTISGHEGLREDEIYSWFVENAADVGIDRDPMGVAGQLVDCADAYRLFVNGKSVNGVAVPYLSNISKLAGGAVRQHLILALAGRHLSDDLFAELIRNIENLFFCYLITREPTKYFEKNFAAWAPLLRDVTDRASLQTFIAGYIHKDMAKRTREVEFAVRELRQSRIQKYRLQYILAKLTQHVQKAAWDNQIDDTLDHFLSRKVEIEHILPQRPEPGIREGFDKSEEYQDYVGRLGNLALLEKTINGSVSNSHFDAKRPGYAESAFLLTKSIAQKPQVGRDTALNRAVAGLQPFVTWQSEDIRKRQEILTSIARRVWLADLPDGPAEA
jgi:hypothetical protein